MVFIFCFIELYFMFSFIIKSTIPISLPNLGEVLQASDFSRNPMYEVSSDPGVMKPFRHKGPEGFVTVVPYTFSVPFLSSQCTEVREEAHSVGMWALKSGVSCYLKWERGREGGSCEET